MKRSLVGLLLLVPALPLGACGGEDLEVVEGVVIDVDGDLGAVNSFVLRLPDGRDFVFVPAADVSFHGDSPISHINAHLRTGDPVEVHYTTLDNGTLSVREIYDVAE
jgi:hypothetical protein